MVTDSPTAKVRTVAPVESTRVAGVTEAARSTDVKVSTDVVMRTVTTCRAGATAPTVVRVVPG
jgi:hypothetical protein